MSSQFWCYIIHLQTLIAHKSSESILIVSFVVILIKQGLPRNTTKGNDVLITASKLTKYMDVYMMDCFGIGSNSGMEMLL